MKKVILYVLVGVTLMALEIFIYSTTEYALKDLLDSLSLFDESWATILAFAFCSIDLYGIISLFTPDFDEFGFLFSAWFVGATVNTFLIYWGITVAIYNLEKSNLLPVVPVVVAVSVWLIRIFVIGTISTLKGCQPYST